MTRKKHAKARRNREEKRAAQALAAQSKKIPTENTQQPIQSAQSEAKISEETETTPRKIRTDLVSGHLSKSQAARRQKQEAKSRRARAIKNNERAHLLKMPQEVYLNIFSRLSKGDQYHCMQSCMGLYIGVQATFYEELELEFASARVRPTAEQVYPKDAVYDKNLSKKNKRKKIRLEPKVSKTFQCFRISNSGHIKKRLNSCLHHVKTLSVKEDYASWHTSTLQNSFKDFPEEFQFTSLSGFKYEAVNSVIRMQEMIDTLRFVHTLLPTEETTDVEIIRGIILRKKLVERLEQEKFEKAEAEALRKAEKAAEAAQYNDVKEDETNLTSPSIIPTNADAEKGSTEKLPDDAAEKWMHAGGQTDSGSKLQLLGKRKAESDDESGRPSKLARIVPSIFGRVSWYWSNLLGHNAPAEEGAAMSHIPKNHDSNSRKRKYDQDGEDAQGSPELIKKKKYDDEATGSSSMTADQAAGRDEESPRQEPSAAMSDVKARKRKADDANIRYHADEHHTKIQKQYHDSEIASSHVMDSNDDDDDSLFSPCPHGKNSRRLYAKTYRQVGYVPPVVLPTHMSGGLADGDDKDVSDHLRFPPKKGKTLFNDEPDDPRSEICCEDGSYDDGLEDTVDGDDLAVAETCMNLSSLEAAGEAEISDMLNIEEAEAEDLLKDVVLPKTLRVQGLGLKRLELNNLGAVGQRLLWTIAQLFPAVTSLTLKTGPKGAARRWLMGPFDESFRNFRHLGKLHDLTTNFTVYIPTSSVPVDYEHAPVPNKRQLKIKTQPKPASKKNKWKSQARRLERVKLFLDRLPHQFSRRFAAMVCRDQWLIAQIFILREVGKCFTSVEEGGNGRALPMTHLNKLTFQMGETRKHLMTVDIDRSPATCPDTRATSHYQRKGIKLSAEIPYEFLFLGVRERKEFKNVSEDKILSMRADTKAEEEDAAELKAHGNKGHCTWYTAELSRETEPPQPFNHYNMHNTRLDYHWERVCRYVPWDW